MVLNNKNNILERITLLFFVLTIFSFGIYNSGVFFNFCLLILILFLFLLSSDFRLSFKKNIRANFLFIILIILLFFNVLLTNNVDYLFPNFILLLRCILVAFVISNIYKEDNNVFENFINSKFLLFNIFWILNLIILFFQVKGTGLLIKSEWFLINPMYEDHCSGLFGFSGTHYLSFYSVFILIYNLYYASLLNNCSKKNFINIYNFVTVIIMLILSTMNDNNSIFVLYIVFSFYFFIIKNILNKRFISVFFKLFGLFIFVVFLLFVLSFIPSVSNYLNSKFLNVLISIIDFNNSVGGSSERLAIFVSAIENYNGFLFGLGFGSWTLIEKSFLGFKHFGISSIGTFTTLCGFWIYLVLLFLFSSMSKGKYFDNKVLNMLNFFTILILSIYTIVFSNYLIIIMLYFTFCILDLNKKKEV